MYCHCNNVLMMHIEELLLFLLFIIDNTNTGSCEDDLTILIIAQVSSCIETSKSMCPFQCQIVFWCFTHGPGHLEAIRYTCIDLTTPNINTTSLITFFKFCFSEFFFTLNFSTIIFECFCAFLVGFSNYLRFLGCFTVHKVFPLENALIFSTS